jgi:hypothetical protein
MISVNSLPPYPSASGGHIQLTYMINTSADPSTINISPFKHL